MFAHMIPPNARQCWFCSQTPCSRSQLCDCKGAVLPTMNKHGNTLTWTIFSFGTHAEFSERSSFSNFDHARAIFYSRTNIHVALRLGDSQERYIILRYSDGTRLFSVHRNETTSTVRLDEALEDDLHALQNYVMANLQGEETVTVPSKLDKCGSFQSIA